MVVLSNHRLGRGFEVLASDATARRMFRALADAAAGPAASRWEHELVRWLQIQAARGEVIRPVDPAGPRPPSIEIDVGEIAWSRDHFAAQKQFVIDAIDRSVVVAEYAGVLRRWRELVEAHPVASVQVGRRWNWQPTA